MATTASRIVEQPPTAASRTARVAIAGATGYAGQELVRLLARHPAVTLTEAMSSGATSAPRPLPALKRIWDGSVTPLDLERLAAGADIVMLALPEAAAAEVGTALLERGVRVIDLSGAFRIRSDADRQRWYPATTTLPAGVVYALPERHADAIRQAKLASCPGCYPTAALLALEPLAAAGLLEGAIVIDAKSGISGAGKTPSDRTHFSENHGSVAAYSVFSHRHAAEIEQELGAGAVAELRQACIEGGVNLIGCQMTIDLFGFKRDEFIPEVKDFVGAATFLPMARDADVSLFI